MREILCTSRGPMSTPGVKENEGIAGTVEPSGPSILGRTLVTSASGLPGSMSCLLWSCCDGPNGRQRERLGHAPKRRLPGVVDIEGRARRGQGPDACEDFVAGGEPGDACRLVDASSHVAGRRLRHLCHVDPDPD